MTSGSERRTASIDEDSLVIIHKAMQSFLINKHTSLEEYKLLKIMEGLLDAMQTYSSNDSEASVTRRFATILDFLLRSTKVRVREGEISSNATQQMRQYNAIVFGESSKVQCGRKIDILLACDSNSAKPLELSSIEIKKPGAHRGEVEQQQNKNL
ncbi:hypothetical protein DM01DRAFT_322888 [Hesseltinella vesiculosa]|uniref:Uncharacterized protein n=1 Tax=Hesseltinella vesiculosa TaxID=101127 RepID=A0A1X2GAG8_9FUNG|nr:hypothetical protein DM01DRAFT_322888 [Hesseltinella vesiculosa]